MPRTSVLRFRKCGENRDLATRPWFYASATCSFVRKNRVVVWGCLFFPHFRNMGILAAIQVPYNAMQQGATLKIYFARSRFSLSLSRSTRELDALSSGMANVLGTIPTSDTVKSSFLTILLTIMVSKMVRIWVE